MTNDLKIEVGKSYDIVYGYIRTSAYVTGIYKDGGRTFVEYDVMTDDYENKTREPHSATDSADWFKRMVLEAQTPREKLTEVTV